MKILHVYKDFDPPVRGGMEKHIALMCRFQREWAEVEALTCSRSFWTRRIDRDGTLVTEVGEWGRLQGAPLSPLFPLHMGRSSVDLMVVHVPNPTAEVGYLLRRPRCAMVVRYHSDVVRQAAAMKIYRPVLMKFLSKAGMIIPTSERYLQTSSVLCEFEERCRVVPLGIVAEDFSAPDNSAVVDLRARYGEHFVLFSGRHRYYKGLEYLVRASRAIRATVVIAGDGPERPKLEVLAQDIDVPVKFVGSLTNEELVNHLHACSVFAFPSVERSEAFGISILEAQVCGKPVVATTLGTGVEYANLDGETGLNVPCRDEHAFAEAVNTLLEDDERREAMGAFAKSRVLAEFDARSVAAQEFALYQEALECSKTGT